ncbi:MAG TPA: GNAT family N-acetyltransferase, partial [Nitrospiraceae bacterium]|nr:GNAT family N-acetyltransferase [Nitrospiraceae bacterium]
LLIGAERGDGYLDDHTPELAIGVLPAHRGGGVGTELLRFLLEAARVVVSRGDADGARRESGDSIV